MPAPRPDDEWTVPAQLAAVLGPFVAWLATRDPDEEVRRRHREVVECYLWWAAADRGALSTRRRRFEDEVVAGRVRLSGAAGVHEALERFAEHRAIVAATRAVEQ